MSTVSFIERDGQRLEVNPAEIKTERRCDGCGEFLPESGDRATAHVSIDLDPGGAVMHRHDFELDAHRDHLAAAIARVVDTDAD